MKKRFTILITAALMLLTMMASTGTMWGQSDYSTTYTSGVTLSTTSGTSASTCKVIVTGTTEYDGIKAGTSKVAGAMVITVPSGTKYLHLHAVGWNGESVTLSVTPNTNISPSSISLTADSGISNNSPFTLGTPANAPTNYYKVITFTNALTANTDLTFTATSGKRFVIWGVNAEEEGGGDDPTINANNVNIAYNATQGSITYTLNNATGNVSASITTGDWLTLGTITASEVPFTCSANEAAAARTATVTLSFTGASNKVVTITQAGNPNVVNNISDITAAGNYTVKGTIVAMSTRGFVLGDGTGYVYYYYGNNFSTTYTIGDIVKLSGAVTASDSYKVFQFTSGATITAATESNYVAEDPTVLSGADMDAQVASTAAVSLSNYVQYQGTLTVSNTFYNITSIDGATTAKGSISYPTNTDFTSLNGKVVTVTGYYVGISSNQYYNTMIGSIEEVVVTTPTISVSPATVNAPTEGADGTLTITYENIPDLIAFNIQFCDANGDELQGDDPDWIDAEITEPTATTENYTVSYIIDANDGEARSAYFKVFTYTGTNLDEVYSNLVTINQDEYVAPTYAELPFAFNGGRADIENTDGLYHEGLGSDYNSAPKLKFDGTGDWLLLQFQERPGTLTFKIKGNGYSSGSISTFKVQTSADGTTYTDLATYTELGDTQTESFDNLNENIRYIKWIYTEKGATSGGNVALGDINLAVYVAPVASIIVNPELIEAPATPVEPATAITGSLTVTLNNITITELDQLGVDFCDENGTILTGTNTEPSWFESSFELVNEEYKLNYTIAANTDANERVAYFKVYEIDSEVYSNKVTVTQEAYIAPTATITVNPDLVEATAAEADGNLGITLENITISQVDSHFEVYFCDENGTIITDQASEPDWLIGVVQLENSEFSLHYMIDENTTSEARTAYMKVYGLSDDGNTETYSNKITFTQAGATPTFAVIFDLDGGTFVGNDDFPTVAEEKEAGTYTLPSATKDNTNFAGWLLDGTENIYAAGESYEVTADVSFTAQWSNALTGTISFGSGQGSTNINSASVSGNDNLNNTWTITTEGTTSFTPNSDYAQIGSGSKPATSITFTMTLPYDANITAFSAKFGGFSGTAGNITLKVGETTVGTGSLNATADVTVENTTTAYGKMLTITVTSISKGVKAYYISYSYTMSTDPIINAPASIDLASDATSGEIEYSIINPAIGVSIDATTTDSWISDFVITDEKVSFTTTANTEMTERQGTITLSYTGAENKDVTVIQAAYIPPFASTIYTKATSITSGEHYIIVGFNGTDAYAMGLQNNNNRGAVIVNEDGTTATVTNENVYDLVINYVETTDEKDYYSIYDARTPGYLYAAASGSNHLKTETTLSDNSKWVITFADGHANIVAEKSENRNVMQYNSISTIFSCYGSYSQTPVYLYAKSNVAPTTNNTTVTGTDFTATTPAGYRLIASPVTVNPVTTGMTTNEYDLYSFDESEETEWRNYKASHFNIIPGKGYLYANSSTTELTFTGSPYEGDGKIALDYTDGASFAGWNLIGNPFGTAASLDQPYYRLNSDGSALNVETESSDINVMEGVFVQATAADQIATFTAQTRNAKHRSIAQANIMISQNGSILDKAIVRFDNGSTLGKFQLNENSSKVFFTKNSQDYAIVCSDAQGEMPVNFKAAENGTYTIDFSMDNVEFSYLHLIDNKTGMDIDLLQTSSYTFEASKIDYASRFKLVFSSNSNSNDDNDFAFIDANGNLLILGNEGTATLQVIDITGRTVSNETFSGNYSKAINAKAGVYMLRLIQGNDVRTQKIVVR